MDKIVIRKQSGVNIRRDGVQVRIAPDINERLDSLSEETNITKTRLIDVFLRKAMEAVEIVESDL